MSPALHAVFDESARARIRSALSGDGPLVFRRSLPAAEEPVPVSSEYVSRIFAINMALFDGQLRDDRIRRRAALIKKEEEEKGKKPNNSSAGSAGSPG